MLPIRSAFRGRSGGRAPKGARLAAVVLAGWLVAAMTSGTPVATAGPGGTCGAMKDPLGCACALETGGTVSGGSWARGPDRRAFENCILARGGKPAQKPPTIPARR